MRSIVKDLWDGSLVPRENLLCHSKEVPNVCEMSETVRERIETALPDGEKFLLDRYDELNLTISGAGEEEAFRRGIAVGIRLMMEVTEYDDV